MRSPGLSFNHNSAGALKAVVTTSRLPSQFRWQLTSSAVHCQSIVQVSACQVVLNLLLPHYLENWASYKSQNLVYI
jgi:hypothetical protein